MNSYKRLLKKIINVKFKHINSAFGNSSFKLLDVGAGNRSCSKTKSVFPNLEYYGLDLNRETDYVNEDFKQMSNFYELDLTKLNLEIIPENYFDYINMAHVIEHLFNGDKVIPLLLTKLKSKGYFYIEYPGRKSLRLPSMYGTLNFYDDPTHVRVYSIDELKKVFEENGCEVLKCGTRRNLFYIALTPVRMVVSLIQIGKIRANVFWDLLGFAEYLYVRKL